MDTQLVEVLGRSRLVDQLVRAGLEVALPVRDRGVDLIAYLDRADGLDTFAAIPIQLKAASRQAFSLDAKYAHFPGLVIAYVWNVDSPEPDLTFALSYAEAFAIAVAMGWTETGSWQGGRYANSDPGAKLRALLEPFRMSAQRWRERVLGVTDSGD